MGTPELTRAEIEAIRDAENDVGDYMYRHGTKAGRAINQLLRQLDAASHLERICPIGISPESSAICSAGVCDVCSDKIRVDLIKAESDIADLRTQLNAASASPDVAQAARVVLPWLDTYERKVAKVWRDDGTASKHDMCRHGLPMYNGCGDCLEEDIRAIAGETP